jgi:hypothetical protein
LISRADARNIFMNPALVRLAADAYVEGRRGALLAWRDVGGAMQLVGVWALAVTSAPHAILPLRVLTAPPTPHAYLATPVIDRECPDAVLTAMLDYIESDASLPNIVALDAIAADSDTALALNRVLGSRGSTPCVLGRSQRPKLASDLDAKSYFEKALSSSSRKKLRQHRRRLAEKGALDFKILTGVDAVTAAFNDFLALEAAGWKGRNGTALSNGPSDAAYARAMIATLAATGDAEIHMLSLDGRAVSMQIVLRAGATAYTWKTAYDESLQDFSPGMLLLEDYTAAFLADDSIACVDSCAFDDSSYMSAWSEREAMAQLWFDARRGGSIHFAVLSRLQMGYLALRSRAKAIYLKYLQRAH